MPSAAVRLAFLAAFRPLALRRSSMAFSRSPSASTRAFLHSIMPSPVRSRNSLTMLAVIPAITLCLTQSDSNNGKYIQTAADRVQGPEQASDPGESFKKRGIAPFLVNATLPAQGGAASAAATPCLGSKSLHSGRSLRVGSGRGSGLLGLGFSRGLVCG